MSFTHFGEVRKSLPSHVTASKVPLAVGLFDRQFCSLESDAAVGAVAKRFVDRAAAAAERERWFAGEVVRGSVGVDEFNRTFGRFHAERVSRTDCDLYLILDFDSSNLTDF